MKGDFTRLTFDPNKHYSAVYLQQGRVALDADWNEQVAIDAHLRETALTDLVGKTGAPMTGGGFEVLVAALSGRDLLISPGRFYVDGILCEAETGYEVEIHAVTILPASPWVTVSVAALRACGLAPNDAVQVVGPRHQPFYVQLLEIKPPLPGATQQEIRLSQDFYQDRGTGRQWIRPLSTYLRQPHLTGSELPAPERTYLVYLDVWKRHVTALEDPAIREVALGGPDTATRTQTVWQVKLFEIAGVNQAKSSFCLLDPEGWASHIAPSSGRLLARTSPPLQPDSPCVVPTDAGYTLLENQLYRVEVHLGSDAGGGPTFKWSRDNGTVVSAWQPQPPGDSDASHVKVASLGRDEVLDFDLGQWIELTDDAHELEGRPGLLVKITAFEGETLIIEPSVSLAERAKFTLNPKARRWDHTTGGTGGVPATAGGWIPLEGSLEIAFDFNLGDTLRTGDYWLIPARAFIGEHHGSIEWPRDSEGGDPLALLPHGIEHHYARLAVVDFRSYFVELVNPAQDSTRRIDLPPDPGPWLPPQLILPTFSGLADCRRLFPAVTELTRIVGLCACNQKALPGEKLPQPIGVAVFNGEQPVAGVSVQFTVTRGGGTLQGSAGQTGDVVKETTGENGLVFCDWILGLKYEPQQVTAVRLDAAGQEAVGAEECFTASQSVPVLRQLCGDGQPVFPGRILDGNLAVAVWVDGLRPLLNALVQFEIVEVEGQGFVQVVPEPGQIITFGEDKAITVFTKANGIAQARWFPDTKILTQRVRATLLDRDRQPLGAPVCFTATLNLASQVQYDPAGCKVLQQAGANDAQKALDELCKRLPPPDRPSFSVRNVFFLADSKEALNDSRVVVDRFTEGLRIACTAPIAPESVAATPGLAGAFPGSVPHKPACAVVLDLPLRQKIGIVGFQPLLLQAEVSASGSDILWQPNDAKKGWLRSIFSHVAEGTDAVRACLTLQGNLIWTPGPHGQPKAYLAGKPLGRLAAKGRVDLVRFRLPLPDIPIDTAALTTRTTEVPVAGAPQAVVGTIDEVPMDPGPTAILGTEVAEPLVMWFWLVPSQLVLSWSFRNRNVVGTVKDADGTGLPAVTVELSGPAAARTATTDASGNFRIVTGMTPAGIYTLTAQREGAAATQVQVTLPAPEVQPAPPPTPPQAQLRDIADSAGPGLAEVRGIGPVLRARLEEAGVTRSAELAALEPARLTEILRVSEAQAKTLIDNARLVAEKGDSSR